MAEPISHPRQPRLRSIARRSVLSAAIALLPMAAAAGDRPFLPDTVVSSTVPENGDLNPYGVAVVPLGFPSGGPLAPGDVLVSNFNNSDNLQGTGTTIIKLTPNGLVSPAGQALEFFKGSFPGLTTALGVLKRGFVLVGSVSTTDGKFGTIKAGPLLFLDRNGNVIPPSPFTTKLDGPWDLTIDDQFDHARVFVSNVLNRTVTRLDLTITAKTVTVKAATVIASGYTSEENDAALILGPTGLAYDPEADVLFVASTADNMIFAVPHAGARTGSSGRGTIIFQDDHLRGPLALVFAPNGDLLTANGDAVNDDPTQPSEIVEFTRKGRFVRQFNVDAAQGGAFGIGLASVGRFVRFAFIDDNASDLTVTDRKRPELPDD
jgi:DNA-binding beta-propeller fold protein YncE